MIIIGEKINGSIPSVAEAIANRDAEFIKQRALAQANSGAVSYTHLDVYKRQVLGCTMSAIMYCGQRRTDCCNRINCVYDMWRDILHESTGILRRDLAMVPGFWKNIGEEDH